MTAFFLLKLNIRIFNHKISIYKIYFPPLFLLKKAPFKPFQYVLSSKNNHLSLIFLIYCIIFLLSLFSSQKSFDTLRAIPKHNILNKFKLSLHRSTS